MWRKLPSRWRRRSVAEPVAPGIATIDFPSASAASVSSGCSMSSSDGIASNSSVV